MSSGRSLTQRQARVIAYPFCAISRTTECIDQKRFSPSSSSFPSSSSSSSRFFSSMISSSRHTFLFYDSHEENCAFELSFSLFLSVYNVCRDRLVLERRHPREMDWKATLGFLAPSECQVIYSVILLYPFCSREDEQIELSLSSPPTENAMSSCFYHHAVSTAVFVCCCCCCCCCCCFSSSSSFFLFCSPH